MIHVIILCILIVFITGQLLYIYYKILQEVDETDEADEADEANTFYKLINKGKTSYKQFTKQIYTNEPEKTIYTKPYLPKYNARTFNDTKQMSDHHKEQKQILSDCQFNGSNIIIKLIFSKGTDTFETPCYYININSNENIKYNKLSRDMVIDGYKIILQYKINPIYKKNIHYNVYKNNIDSQSLKNGQLIYNSNSLSGNIIIIESNNNINIDTIFIKFNE